MSELAGCPNCGQAFEAGDQFCAACGHPSARIQWSLSPDRSPSSGTVRINPGGSLFVVAANRGLSAVRVEVDPSTARGVVLLGTPTRRVAPGQAQAFELTHHAGQEIGGGIGVRAETGPRPAWWERRSWKSGELRLSLQVQVREERWLLGSPVVLFPPGVLRQHAQFWNDSDYPRRFTTDVPAGYRVTRLRETVDGRPTPVGPGEALELVLHAEGSAGTGSADTEWRAGPDSVTVPLLRLPSARPDAGADLVVAIDFGTRNTGVRVRWRRAIVAGKPAGSVDPVGDRGRSARFPTQMVLDLRERSFRWGTDAADYIAASRMTSEEVAVGNLKTYLREGVERFTQLKPEWTNAELLSRYFERILHRLDQYLRQVGGAQPLSRHSLDIRFVVCRPVLDANEGDEKGRRYEAALRQALVRGGVPESAISFVQEPVAAAIGIARRRAGELLKLEDGTAVAVVDSGGGTTDVALARVRLQSGQVDLDLKGSYALHLAPENPAVAALAHYGQHDRLELGGNVLDWALAHRLSTRAGDLLEGDGRPVPPSLWSLPSGAPPQLQAARLREWVLVCRRMKERFARVSTQYLNRAPGQPREEGEVLPFPTRDDLQGVRLVHALYDDHLLAPILRPTVGELAERIGKAQDASGGIRPSEVRRVFYVGGTNIDPFVREHFGRAFPLAAGDNDPEAQSDERIAERLNAVVDGAVWLDEQLFSPSPVTLSVRLREREEVLVKEGAALLPRSISPVRYLSDVLEPGEELDAVLVASGGGLAEPLVVARGYYRNEDPLHQEAVLALTTSLETGAAAELRVGERRLPQWRFALVEVPA